MSQGFLEVQFQYYQSEIITIRRTGMNSLGATWLDAAPA